MQDFQISLINAAGVVSNSVVVTARDELTARLAAQSGYSGYVAGNATKVWPAGTIYGGIDASMLTDDDIVYMVCLIANRRAHSA